MMSGSNPQMTPQMLAALQAQQQQQQGQQSGPNFGLLNTSAQDTSKTTAQQLPPQQSLGQGLASGLSSMLGDLTKNKQTGQGQAQGASGAGTGTTAQSNPLKGLLNGLFGKNNIQAANQQLGQGLALQEAPGTGRQNNAPDSQPRPQPQPQPYAPGLPPLQTSQNGQQLPPQSQLANTQGSANLSIPNIIQMAHQQFPNNPNQANLAAAQAIQESGLAGRPSQLATKHNNLFGMKGRGDQGSVNYASSEYGSGGWSKPTSGFASYSSPQQSFQAYGKLMDNPRYAKVKSAKSFGEAAEAVKQAGYATDPNYTSSLNNIYQKYIVPNEQQSSGSQQQSQTSNQQQADTGSIDW